MKPATTPTDRRDQVRLLVVAPDGIGDAGPVAALADHLDPGDLVVLNDAATLPASLRGSLRGEPIELRLAQPPEGDEVLAVLFGAGDWRTRTEDRAAPPPASPGERVELAGLTATVVAVDPRSDRLLRLRFDRAGDALLAAIYERGAVVQYAHLDDDVALWSAQSLFATRPWAVESPSAGRPLSGAVLAALRQRGVHLATLTHAAGLSATGDPALDAALPLPERYVIPPATARAVRAALAEGRRVIAVGTTVVRALEDCARKLGSVYAGRGTAELRVDASYRPRVVNAVLSGMHQPGESHFELLEAFAPREELVAAHRHAVARGYRAHEFGDVALVVTPRGAATRSASPRLDPPSRSGPRSPSPVRFVAAAPRRRAGRRARATTAPRRWR